MYGQVIGHVLEVREQPQLSQTAVQIFIKFFLLQSVTKSE